MKDVLIAAVGLTPQVVTETLWALYHRRPSVRISEIWALTTMAGRQACLDSLLMPETGRFHVFCKEYGIRKGSIQFDRSNLIVLNGAKGQPLDDIRTEEESRAVADQIAEFVRRQADRPNVRLHGSVAGGRKTMGIYLAFAFQLYGRAQDRLYHVLVNEPFESNPEFFYKPRRPRMIFGLGGQRLNTKDARIELTEIPFLRIRHKLGPLQDPLGFSGQVRQAQREVDQLMARPRLIIYLRRRFLQIGDIKVPLSAKQMALYTYFAKNKSFYRLQDIVADRWSEVLAFWKMAGGRKIDEKKPPEEGREIWPDISRINKAIRKALQDPNLAIFYTIGPEADQRQWDGHYGLKLDSKKILIEE